MRKFSLLSLVFVAMAVCAPQVWAQNASGPKTREQVRAELMEAIRTGNMPANDDSGCLLNEINPSAYPPQAGTAL